MNYPQEIEKYMVFNASGYSKLYVLLTKGYKITNNKKNAKNPNTIYIKDIELKHLRFPNIWRYKDYLNDPEKDNLELYYSKEELLYIGSLYKKIDKNIEKIIICKYFTALTYIFQKSFIYKSSKWLLDICGKITARDCITDSCLDYTPLVYIVCFDSIFFDIVTDYTKQDLLFEDNSESNVLLFLSYKIRDNLHVDRVYKIINSVGLEKKDFEKSMYREFTPIENLVKNRLTIYK